MPRPNPREVTFTIDGREVTAAENCMLVDGAKNGDVEIPVFCYEPKLGAPVGACRMCLVEVEGIPKLQTACSTPVKDGMVVHTQTERVHAAQRAVVEFLLVNHPLDCPVCDKGGECPLQDITYGWGAGTSRFIEPKRHFKKPLELSPLIAIDRERCILCYRCVRFSQEISEDYQLVLLERGAAAFVGTFDGRPYVAPFSGNITELCPVGALTSSAYRFRARPWDIEGAGTICTLCPSQCNVTLTVRDDRVLRVLARDNDEVDDGWLCDKGRFAYQHVHVEERITRPMVREGLGLHPTSWERALSVAAGALSKAGAKVAAVASGETTNEEAFLLRRLLDGLGAKAPPDPLPAELFDPARQATVSDLQYANAILLVDCDPLDDAAIWDLRIRKGVRRHGVRLSVASAHPTALDSNARSVLRFAPGATEAFLVALDAAISGDEGNLGGGASAAGTKGPDVRDLAAGLEGDDVIIVAAERTLTGGAAKALLNVATRLGAKLLVAPIAANGRGVREAGLTTTGAAPDGASVLYLLHADPLRDGSDRAAWESALSGAQTVIAHESVLTETVREHADVVFPAEAYAEKEGTVTHPDGRVQRLRPAIGRPGDVRAGWQVIANVARRAGHDLDVLTGVMASRQLFESVPRYRGLTLEGIGAKGVRPEAGESAAWEPKKLKVPKAAPAARKGTLRLGTFRTLWASKEVDVSPALQFAKPAQVVELSLPDAERIGVLSGDEVEVGSNGTRIRGRALVRGSIPVGTVFVAEGVEGSPANSLNAALVEVAVAARDDDAPAEVSEGGEAGADTGEHPPTDARGTKGGEVHPAGETPES